MRVSLLALLIVLGLAASAAAQQKSAFKVKSTPDKPPRSTVVSNPGRAPASATAKDLQAAERQNTKVPASTHTTAKKSSASAAIKPERDSHNAPINFGGAGGGKQAGMINKGSNPYKGRLREKHGQN